MTKFKTIDKFIKNTSRIVRVAYIPAQLDDSARNITIGRLLGKVTMERFVPFAKVLLAQFTHI